MKYRQLKAESTILHHLMNCPYGVMPIKPIKQELQELEICQGCTVDAVLLELQRKRLIEKGSSGFQRPTFWYAVERWENKGNPKKQMAIYEIEEMGLKPPVGPKIKEPDLIPPGTQKLSLRAFMPYRTWRHARRPPRT